MMYHAIPLRVGEEIAAVIRVALPQAQIGRELRNLVY